MINRKSKKNLNFNINLIPVIDILSCCICFLLLTVEWVTLGSIDIKQALKSQPTTSQFKPAEVWVYMRSRGQLLFEFKNSAEKVKTVYPITHWDDIKYFIGKVQKNDPGLTQAKIFPDSKSDFQDIIHLMDLLRETRISQIGITPL